MTRVVEAPSQGVADDAAALRDSMLGLLEDVRARTLLLLRPLTDEDARTQHDPLMSPIIWDLGHIAAFEQLWLQEQIDRDVRFGEMPGLYNPFEHPRATRGTLPLPGLAAAIDHLAQVRSATRRLFARDGFDPDSPLRRGGYVYRMVAQHESQHQETILQTLQLKRGGPYRPLRRMPHTTAPESARAEAAMAQQSYGPMVSFPGGAVTVGSDDTSAYDNERPAHSVTLRPFAIDVFPVTNDAYREFLEAGGYADERLWTEAGRSWLRESQARAPRYWRQEDGTWFERMFDVEAELAPRRPVAHVCFHEAEAFARWAGKRLPTELEWETAARWHPDGPGHAYPWGDSLPDRAHANVDQLAFSTAPIGTYARNVSPLGCYGLVGDLWEWTSSDFMGYPGFRSFPYREYSEEFFGGDYKVLRGGSWATAPHVARTTFRNWDFPVRRQIFAGFRCARDN